MCAIIMTISLRIGPGLRRVRCTVQPSCATCTMHRTARARERVTVNLNADLRQRIEVIARAEHRSLANAIVHLAAIEADRRLPSPQRTEQQQKQHEARAA